jgi:hypothetical protein
MQFKKLFPEHRFQIGNYINIDNAPFLIADAAPVDADNVSVSLVEEGSSEVFKTATIPMYQFNPTNAS